MTDIITTDESTLTSTAISKQHTSLDSDITAFAKFVKSCIVHRGKGDYRTITHSTLGSLAHPIAKYNASLHISDEMYDKFVELYSAVIGKMNLHIVEKSILTAPFILDVDFVSEKSDRQYTETDIINIIKAVNSVFTKYTTASESDLTSYVFEKAHPTYNKATPTRFKDGFHIVYPNMQMDVPLRYFILDEVTRMAEVGNYFEHIDKQSKYCDILDHNIIHKNGILMYGSHKQNCRSYELTKIYDYNANEQEMRQYSNSECVMLMSRRKPPTNVIDFKPEYVESMVDKIEEICKQYKYFI